VADPRARRAWIRRRDDQHRCRPVLVLAVVPWIAILLLSCVRPTVAGWTSSCSSIRPGRSPPKGTFVQSSINGSLRPHAVILSCSLVAGFFIAAPAARSETVSLSVDSRSDIYASGLSSPSGTSPHGSGIIPPSISLPLGTGRVVTFNSVTGSVSYNDVDAPDPYRGQYNGPDGGAVWFADANFPNNFLTTSSPAGLIPPAETLPGAPRPSPYTAPSTTFYVAMDPYASISGMTLFELAPANRRAMYLSGVFLTDAAPSGAAPASLDFSSTALGRNFSSLAPELQQTFYIGDGLTGEGSGAVQSFLVPDAATRLFLGFVDGAYFVGGPDFYDNNVGSFAVTAVVVPEPSTCAMALAGLACSGSVVFRRRKRACA